MDEDVFSGVCGVATKVRSISSTSSIFSFILSMSDSNWNFNCSIARRDVVLVRVLLLLRDDLECLEEWDFLERRE